MNLKKKLREFFSLSRKSKGGFTLVELIVVIAVLAILGGVAIPAYSGYVTKANKQADISLATDIARSLTLQHYAHPGTEGGYVVLKADGSTAGYDVDAEGNSVGLAALQAAFGDGWEEACKLKYDGWTNNGLMQVVASYTPEDAARISNSTFMKNPEGMMDAATGLLGIASDRIFGSSNVAQHIANLGGDLGATLEELDLNPESEEYSTAVSNLLVDHFANAIASGEVLDGTTKNVSELATFYAQVYAYCEIVKDPTLKENLDNLLGEASYDEISGEDNVRDFKIALRNADRDKWDGLQTYMSENSEGDKEAFLDMMKAVSVVSNEYKDKNSLTNTELYSSPEIMNQVDSFTNAVKSRANGKFPDGSNLSDGEIVVVLYADGNTACTIELEK